MSEQSHAEWCADNWDHVRRSLLRKLVMALSWNFLQQPAKVDALAQYVDNTYGDSVSLEKVRIGFTATADGPEIVWDANGAITTGDIPIEVAGLMVDSSFGPAMFVGISTTLAKAIAELPAGFAGQVIWESDESFAKRQQRWAAAAAAAEASA